MLLCSEIPAFQEGGKKTNALKGGIIRSLKRILLRTLIRIKIATIYKAYSAVVTEYIHDQ